MSSSASVQSGRSWIAAAALGKQALAGGLHPDDRQRWRTDGWVESAHPREFVDAMREVSGAMVAAETASSGSRRR